MAIELAAFAARIKRQPDLAKAWLNAGDDDASYLRYSRIFSGQKLFPEDDALLTELGRRFDHTSKLSHPSVYALAEHSRFERTQTQMKMQFHYFPVKRDDPSEPTRTYLWLIDTHFGVLKVFEQVLGEALEPDRHRWEVHRNAVDGKLSVHKAHWKDVILGKPGGTAAGPTGLIIIPTF